MAFLAPLVFVVKEVAAEVASQATGGATDFLSVRRMGTKAITAAVKHSADDAAGVVAKKIHGNTAGDQPATLYEKYDKVGEFLKHGITKHEDPTKRYTSKQIDGGTVVATDRGPRTDMLKKERDLVETNPGPANKEPWAGKRKEL